jgi:hypothetical protein
MSAPAQHRRADAATRQCEAAAWRYEWQLPLPGAWQASISASSALGMMACAAQPRPESGISDLFLMQAGASQREPSLAHCERGFSY